MKTGYTRAFAVAVLLSGALALSLASVDVEDPEEPVKCCAWEERHGECGSSASSGSWEQKCIDTEVGSPAYEQQCAMLDDDTTECGGSCCLSYEYRNLSFLDGTCADNGHTAL